MLDETDVVLPEDLATSELLSCLPPEALAELALAANLRHWAPMQVIFKEGDPGSSLHIVLRGIIKIVQTRDGGEAALGTLGPGKEFGELSALDPAPRSATAIAIDTSETVEVEREELVRFLDRYPRATRDMLGKVARRLTVAGEQLKNHNQILQERVREQTAELRETQLEIIRRLGRAAEFRDDDTGFHITRMSQYAAVLAEKAGLTDHQCETLVNAAPMHDVGKIGIPDRVLLKPGRLDPEEFELMKTHTTIGEALLSGSKSPVMQMARVIALSHHEKWNGTGYPQGLAAEDIPLLARICAICDVFDALTSDRPYKKAWEVQDAIDEIKKGAGAHFDPRLVELFLDMQPQILAIKEKWTKERAEA